MPHLLTAGPGPSPSIGRGPAPAPPAARGGGAPREPPPTAARAWPGSEAIRARHPVSLHGVCSRSRPTRRPMRSICGAWRNWCGASSPRWCPSTRPGLARALYYPDLLPFRASHEALTRIAAGEHQRHADALGRAIATRTPRTTRVRRRHTIGPETDFLAELARRTGCGRCCWT